MGAGNGDEHAGRADGQQHLTALLPAGVELQLDRVEARRRQLFVIAAIAALGAATVATLVLVVDSIDLPAWLGWALLVTTGLFVMDAAGHERALAGLTRAALAQQARGAELEATVTDLAALHAIARRVNASLLPEEVYDVVLAGAVELLDAERGSIRLRIGDRLAVAASVGPQVSDVGAMAELGDDPAVVVVTLGVDVREDDPPRLAVPITVGLRHVGVLEVERAMGREPFTDRLTLIARLFAEEAATAFVNANRFDAERTRVETLAAERETRTGAVADTVHDLRAPLAGLVGFAELLRTRHDRLDETQRQAAVDAVVEQAHLMTALVNGVFEAASAEARAMQVREAFDVMPVVDAALATVRGGDVEVDIDVVTSGPTVALGEAEALQRVVTNLVSNAVEHGGRRVQVRVGTRKGELWLHVADRGEGIDGAELADIFRRSPTSGTAPRGRGLPIVESLVTAMGGRVAVRSEPGVGSVFTVRLPAPAGDA